jgi:DNA-binding NarL/FixJ family response regulator
MDGVQEQTDPLLGPAPRPDAVALRHQLETLLDGSPAECASWSRFDPADDFCRIEATAGPTVLAPGVRMPIGCSSNFRVAADGGTFVAPDLTAGPDYDRSWDRVTLDAGIRATCTIPLTIGRRTIGALSFSSREGGLSFDQTIDAVLDTSDTLILAMLAEQREPLVTGRAVVCADDPLVAEGIARVAERQLGADVEICGSIEAAAGCVRGDDDLVITDCYVRGLRVDEQTELLRRAGVGVRVVVVASYDTESNRIASRRAGVAGYVPRDESPTAIGDAIAAAQAGDAPVRFPDREPHSDAHGRLTLREGQVLVLLERGLQVKQIARRLGISDSTAKGHVRNVFAKLDVHSSTAAIYAARSTGLLQSLQSVFTTLPDDVDQPCFSLG